MASLNSIGMSIFSAASKAINEKADNLARMGDPDASAKIVNIGTRVINGESAGVEFQGVKRASDQPTLDRIVAQNSVAGQASKKSELSSELMMLFGRPDDEKSLGENINTLVNSLHTLANNSVSPSNQDQVIRMADNLASDINRIATQIQDIRTNASVEIESNVKRINEILDIIVTLNGTIEENTRLKADTVALEDERDKLVNELSTMIDIKTMKIGDNALKITTSTGRILIDNTVEYLSYLSPVKVTATDSYGSSIPGIYLNGEDITSVIKGGELAALVSMRDNTLPAYQDNLDELTIQLRDAINSAHNLGTGFPTPNTLNGSRVFTPGDIATSDATAFSGQGIVRIASIDSNGQFTSYADLDLSTYATIGDLRTAIDGIAGLSTGYNSDGTIFIKATNANDGVGITSFAPNETNNVSGMNFSHYFGFNDLYKTNGWYINDGKSKIGIAQTLQVRDDLLSSPKYLAQMRLSQKATPAIGDEAVHQGGLNVVQEMISALNQSRNFNSSGYITGRNIKLDNFASIVIQDVSAKTSQAKQVSEREENSLAFWKSRLEDFTKIDENKEMADFMALMELYRYGGIILETSKKMNETLMNILR